MSKRVRCAIYTRKSTEEGLDQDFNSLDAQREACEAFIQSQKGLGWVALKRCYDDGGLSGGTMARPALLSLLEDIEKGKVDLVVVYKVDRLTRSLLDFSKIIENFDARGVSFVSVTQQFNTANSMGRLTLNVLLSFAQFEREVTAERIRDKIAASKRKGMWMGGLPPLGYDNVDKKLVINEKEAETVKFIFKKYIQLGSIRALKFIAEQKGITTKLRRTGGGQRFSRGHLAQLLKNPIYIGRITHKGEIYEGRPGAIIEEEVWEAVQQCLDGQAPNRNSATNKKRPSCLAGVLFDESGERLTPTHTKNRGRRYRYYVSRRLIEDPNANNGWRVPAEALEKVVLNGLNDVLETVAPDVAGINDLGTQVARTLLEKVTIDRGQMTIVLSEKGLRRIAGKLSPINDEDLAKVLPFEMRRRGVESKIVMSGKEQVREPDAELIKAIKDAHRWFAQIVRGEAATVREIARTAEMDEGDVSRFLRLAFLAPDIVAAILNGDHPIELTAERLKRCPRMPQSWSEQRATFGFTSKTI